MYTYSLHVIHQVQVECLCVCFVYISYVPNNHPPSWWEFLFFHPFMNWKKSENSLYVCVGAVFLLHYTALYSKIIFIWKKKCKREHVVHTQVVHTQQSFKLFCSCKNNNEWFLGNFFNFLCTNWEKLLSHVRLPENKNVHIFQGKSVIWYARGNICMNSLFILLPLKFYF